MDAKVDITTIGGERQFISNLPNFSAMHKEAMRLTHEAPGIDLHGRKYTPVAQRVEAFRVAFGCWGRLRIDELTEQPFEFEDKDGKRKEYKRIRARAVVELKADGGWDCFAEGYAEEVRGASGVNVKSALENCETSAYGRALANFGLIGGEYASANEMEFEARVSATVAQIRGIFAIDIDDERKAQMIADVEQTIAGNSVLQLAVHDRLKLKRDGSEFNERQAYKDYLDMAKKQAQKTLPNGRKS